MRDGTALVAAAALLAGTVGLGGCVILRSRVAGEVKADETSIGSFVSPMTICQSGARGYFLGVDVASADQRVVMRIIEPPNPGQGPTIILTQASNKKLGLELSRKNCSRLDVDVHPTNVRINGVRVMEGHAAFTCKLHSGGTASGELRFSNCH